MVIVYRADLTAAERKAISERHAPYDRFEAFWTGFIDYQTDIDRKCPHNPTPSSVRHGIAERKQPCGCAGSVTAASTQGTISTPECRSRRWTG